MPTNYLAQIAEPRIQTFLRTHERDDEKALVLKQKVIEGIPSSIIATQLSGRRKAKTKLPTWYKTEGIIYPPGTNMEQCSSEATAIFKTQIIRTHVIKRGVAADITGGFGVDTFFLSSLFESIHYTEPDTSLMEITKHNHYRLGASTIFHHGLLAEEFIEQIDQPFDLIYIDPSRRDEHARKVYRLADCIPDISQLQFILFKRCRFILLKASPLLDIQQALREIRNVQKVFVVSVGNECKELLFLADKNFEGEPFIEAIDLSEKGTVQSSFSFYLTEEKNAHAILGEPNTYLYEPNAAILKSGALKLLGEKFDLTKLDVNTHLYTSSVVVPDFPGKIFQLESLNPSAQQLKQLLPEGKVNIVSRNYPLSPEAIKKKLRLRDGGLKFLIGFSAGNRKCLALCSKVKGI